MTPIERLQNNIEQMIENTNEATKRLSEKPIRKHYPLTKRELSGDEYYRFCIVNYEAARYFLKTCGKPKDLYDRYLIAEARFDVKFFGRQLD